MDGALNRSDTATDYTASMCTGVLAWPFDLAAGGTFNVDLRLPVDDFRGSQDLQEIRADTADALEAANRQFWVDKLDGSGLQIGLPPVVAHLFNEFRLCRANLLILSDAGEIHPGPTIYDSFWFRDSWDPAWAQLLAGRRVVTAMDCDRQGRGAAERITRDLVATATMVKIADVAPYIEDGYDLTDWLDQHRRLPCSTLRALFEP